MQLGVIKTLGALGPQQGDAVRVDGFPGRCRVMNTLSLRSQSYIGDVTIEVSLASSPSEDDWREIATLSFVVCPQTLGINLKGKYVWVRIKYDETQGGVIDTAIVR